jgi:SAM-dependent methyltransferase
MLRWIAAAGFVAALCALGLLTGWLIACLVGISLIGVALIIAGLSRSLSILRIRQRARSLTQRALATFGPDTFTSWDSAPINEETRSAIEAEREIRQDREILIGHIDSDGKVRGPFGELPGLFPVAKAYLPKQSSYSCDIVVVNDLLLVRKDFQKDLIGFYSEWLNIAILYGKANVPAVYKVDEKSRHLYENLILGNSMRENVAHGNGATLQPCTQSVPGARLRETVNTLSDVKPSPAIKFNGDGVSEDLLQELERQIDQIHALGVAGIGRGMENVIVCSKTGSPWFVSFMEARSHRSTTGIRFRHMRDRDRDLFNKLYGRDLLTEKSLWPTLIEQRAKLTDYRDYAPINFGYGFAMPSAWSMDSGTGRWEFFNKHIVRPFVAGKRVLDLGSNNGSMPLMMLRDGAREVIGLEKSKAIANFAHCNHRVFEWNNMRECALRIHNCDMLEVLRADWGRFDVVTAFCSLYYLEEEDMASIVRRASEIAPVIILQGNTAFASGEVRSRKASVPFLKKLLEENGFPHVEIFAPPGYSRPILVGREGG